MLLNTVPDSNRNLLFGKYWKFWSQCITHSKTMSEKTKQNKTYNKKTLKTVRQRILLISTVKWENPSERHGASFDSCNLRKANPHAQRSGWGGDTDSLKKFLRVHLLSALHTSTDRLGNSLYLSLIQLQGAQESMFKDQWDKPAHSSDTRTVGTHFQSGAELLLVKNPRNLSLLKWTKAFPPYNTTRRASITRLFFNTCWFI